MSNLKKDLGLISSISIVIGIVIGSGVFVKQANVLAQAGSEQLSLLAWIVGGIISIAGGLTVAEVAARIPKTGGLYIYIEEIFGKKLGFLCAWVMSIIYGPGLIGALALYFASLFNEFFGLDWNTTLVALSSLYLLVIVNIVGTKYGAYVQSATVFIKLIPIVVLGVVGLFWEKPVSADTATVVAQSTALTGFQFASFAAALLSTLWAYDGWILVTSMAGEMKDAVKQMPRAIIIGLLIVIVAYLSVNISIFNILSPSQITEYGEKAAGIAASEVFGVFGGKFISLGILISIFGCLNGSILTNPRIAYALAAENPSGITKHFAKTHPKYCTPVYAIMLQAVVSSFLIVFLSPDKITDLAIFSVLIFNVLAFVGVFVLRKQKNQVANNNYKSPLYPLFPIIATIGFSYIILATFWNDPVLSMYSVGVMLLGLPIYSLLKAKKI